MWMREVTLAAPDGTLPSWVSHSSVAKPSLLEH
jgi:hypothetical protein